jgi:inner membrane protein yddG
LDLAPSYPWNTKGVLFAVGSALIMGAAYGMWTFGVQKGRIEIMSIMSYFTPVLSCIFASFLIGAKLTYEFWVGVSIVVLGSFICWAATREKHRSPN